MFGTNTHSISLYYPTSESGGFSEQDKIIVAGAVSGVVLLGVVVAAVVGLFKG